MSFRWGGFDMRMAYSGADPIETVLVTFPDFLKRTIYPGYCQNLDVCAVIVNTAIFLLDGD